jgi:hypothetical protein
MSSRAALNSFTARPIPLASSGNLFAPNNSKTISQDYHHVWSGDVQETGECCCHMS